MKIADYIRRVFGKRAGIVGVNYGNVFGGWSLTCHPFGNVIFLNICDILTDLINDVTWVNVGSAETNMLFAEFKSFANRHGQYVMNRLFEDGYLVIGWNDGGFRILKQKEYYLKVEDDVTTANAYDINMQVYVMRSMTYRLKGMSDAAILKPYITYLDNVLNSSNTTRERLGAFVIGSPKTYSGAPTASVLDEDEKEKLEEEISRKYGSLAHQKQMMLTTQEMGWQVINLTGLDARTAEDARLAILAICDRIKVPANQVAIIDANSSKSLSNGSELIAGDFSKYQSFERLLNRTFVEMATEAGLKVDYTIYNKPTREIQVAG